jgi:hypothetical protein
MAERYLYRLSLMAIMAKYCRHITLLTAGPVFLWQFLVNYPQKYFIFFGIPSYIGFFLWVWSIMAHCLGLILIFHQMSYYLKLRFNFVNLSLIKFYKSSRNHRIYELIQILDEHNRICVKVKQYNEFWSIPLLVDAILYTSMVLLISYLAFFSQLVLWLRIFFGSFALIFIVSLFFVFISAASVSTEV